MVSKYTNQQRKKKYTLESICFEVEIQKSFMLTLLLY